MNTYEQAWPVAVFAHNEARRIVACLDSLVGQSTLRPLRIFVLANGCTDDTEDVVNCYAGMHPQVELVKIDLGDKANAWNVFIHDVCPKSDVAFFVDGDVEICAGALDALADTIGEHPEANAAAAVPVAGLDRSALAEYFIKHRLFLGNLYALSGRFVARVRTSGARMPIGYVGEDGLVTSLAKWDLNPRGPFAGERAFQCFDVLGHVGSGVDDRNIVLADDVDASAGEGERRHRRDRGAQVRHGDQRQA